MMCPAALLAWLAMPAAQAGEAADAAPSTVAVEAFFDFENMQAPGPFAGRQRDRRPPCATPRVGASSPFSTRPICAAAKIVASVEDFDVEGVHWVNARRLVFGLYDESESAFSLQSKVDGLYAVDRDGGNFRLLILARARSRRPATAIRHRELSPREYAFDRTLADGSDDVVIDHYSMKETIGGQYRYFEPTGVLPVRLNTRTGELHEMVKGRVPDSTWDWAIDSQGRVLAAMTSARGEKALQVAEKGQLDGTRTLFPPTARARVFAPAAGGRRTARSTRSTPAAARAHPRSFD
jgi:hypothetical protein